MVLNKFDVKKLVGATATISMATRVYTKYEEFAKAAGYPESVDQGRGSDLIYGYFQDQEVSLLAKGKHENEIDVVYVCEASNGLRFLMSEQGLKDIEEGVEMGEMNTKLHDVPIDELYKEIERRAFVAGYRKGKEQGIMSVTDVSVGLVSKSHRDIVVTKAMADISELSQYVSHLEVDAYKVPGGPGSTKYYCLAKFVVNREKRTVVALMHGAHSGRLYGKGIAKCDPSDCFNEHLGKAIALRRAMGLSIPTEYLNAPKPEGHMPGDKTKLFDTGGTAVYRTTERVNEHGKVWNTEGTFAWPDAGVRYGSPASDLIVIDDTARYS